MSPPEALPLSAGEVALVFGLALAAYLLLTLIAADAAFGPRAPSSLAPLRRPLAWLALVLMSGHVALLWSLRYGFDLALATRNGWGGFVSFHLAFVSAWLVLPGDWHARPWRRGVVIAIWLLVTSGAVGAPFRYPIVADLAAPVIAIAALGLLALGAAGASALKTRKARRA